jgi:phosphatidylinositol 3-kinase
VTASAPVNIAQVPVQSAINVNQDPHLWAILDSEMGLENPVEDKHRRLVRSHRNGPLDRELKPNADIRNDLGVSVFISL